MQLRRAQKVEQTPWRPDFRNVAGLPDIKVIRTGFLVNVAAIGLLVALGGIVAYVEYTQSQLRGALAEVSQRLETATPSNNLAVKRSAEFERLAKPLREIRDFRQLPASPWGLARALEREDEAMPVILTALEIQPLVDEAAAPGKKKPAKKEAGKVKYRLVLRGTVVDDPNRPATTVVTEFRNMVGTLPELAERVEENKLTSLVRDDALGVFVFAIEITLKPEEGVKA